MTGTTPTGSTPQVKAQTTAQAAAAGVASFVTAYQSLLKERPGMLASELGGELTWLRKARERDARRWQSLGIPSRQTERWRYTNLAPLSAATISLPALIASSSPMPSATPAATSRAAFPLFEAAGSEIVFLNGRFSAEWSRLPSQEGVSVVVLSKIFEECVAHGWTKERMESFAAFRAHIETSDADRETIFASMNTSFMQDAVLVRIGASVTVEKPIAICYFSDPVGEGGTLAMTSPRVFVHLEKAAKASVIECFAGTDDRSYFTNAVADLRLEERAALSHCKIQLESQDGIHIGTTRIHQKRDSRSETHQFSFGGALSRQDLHISLEAEGAETLLGGLYLVEGKQHVDNYTLVDHVSPHTMSEQVYKGILDGESRAVFNGHVRIMRDAQKSNATQLNNNLVLSPKAEVDTRPELEIDADDVKAAHGATIGQIDQDHVFYLQTRAITKENAVKMLSRGFAQDIAFRVRDKQLREIMIDVVDRQFENAKIAGVSNA
jgi:Fe-S cluster assembly protein SufD